MAMNEHTTQILAALAISIIATLVGSDIIAAEIFTDFDISHKKIQPEQNTTVIVKNTGWLQANNAIVQIMANDTINNYANLCVEGDVQQIMNNNTLLVVKFSRISPAIECKIGLVAHEYVQLNMTVSSDGRITPWTSSSSTSLLPWIALITAMTSLSAALYILIVLSFRKLSKTELCNKFVLWWYKNRFRKAENSYQIKKYVQREYKLEITDADATILELLYLQKTTMGQLRGYTLLSLDRVRYSVEKMRRCELVSKEKMEIHDTLDDFFKRLHSDAQKLV